MCFCCESYVVNVQARLLSGPLGPPARLEIGPDPLPGPLRVLGELAGAAVDDGLDLLFGLLRDRNVAVQVLIHKQADKHLKKKIML